MPENITDSTLPGRKKCWWWISAGGDRRCWPLSLIHILIEEHYDAICDELWYIYTSEEKRRQRLEQNRGYSPERIERMMASQLPEQVFFEHCAVVIDNNGTPEEAIRQVTEILDGTV